MRLVSSTLMASNISSANLLMVVFFFEQTALSFFIFLSAVGYKIKTDLLVFHTAVALVTAIGYSVIYFA